MRFREEVAESKVEMELQVADIGSVQPGRLSWYYRIRWD